ncbi:hypothetical protein ACTFIW_012060 [Dictyostelium discoideum]
MKTTKLNNQVFKHLSTIKVIPKYTYTALLKKTLVLCKKFGLARSSDLVKWSFNGLIITPDSIKGKPLDVKEINLIVLSTLSSSGIDISIFKSHSTRSAMASLLLPNNVPFHVVKKMGL